MKLPESAEGERFDRAVRTLLADQGRDVSVREVRRAIEAGLIRVEGRRVAPGDRAIGGESIDLDRFTPRSEARVEPEPELAVPIIHRDHRLLVLDKPSGMPTQPLRAGERGTLLAFAIAIAPEIGSAGPPLEGGLLHRLDIETSGLVMFALQADLRNELRRAFTEHRITKRYLARVRGTITAPCVVESAIDDQEARTEVEMIAPGLVRATTQYGRRHQVRIHLASIGLPILGDRIYGDPAFPRLALHASEIELPGGETFRSPLPKELEP